jgi:hypothetical protein
MKAITLTRRVTIGIIAIAAVAVLVSATILASYIVPSTVNVTSQPGIVVVTGDIPTITCSTTTVTTFAIGDVQQGQSKAFATICIRNSGGSATQYILPQSLTTQASLPSGLTLTWTNFPTSPLGTGCAGITTGCIQLLPTQQTPPLSLSFSVSTTATPGTVSFTAVFNAYSSATG